MTYALIQGDAVRLPLGDQVCDLIFGSPPYMNARTYGIGAQRDCLAWVTWMLAVTAEAHRVSRGPVCWVAAGVTRDRNYWPGCEGLMWEWWRRGGECQLYRPCYFHRVGIPGSGGDDWFRFDVEYIMCFKRPGPLPWSDNTACGHPPKWAPGGDMSHRITDGTRRNQWGGGEKSGASRSANGSRQKSGRPSHKLSTKSRTKRMANGKMQAQGYHVPAIANPGTLISLKVGGNLMGHKAAHQNEAPFPEDLPRFFIRSLCPPDGLVLDPFVGSGTTVSVALQEGRRGIGLDIRPGRGGLATAHQRLTRPHAPIARSEPEESLPLFDGL